jgi:adenylate kinase
MKNIIKNEIIIMLGLQGSGKGTQANILVDRYGFQLIEMGALIRNGVKTKSMPEEDIRLTTEGKLITTETAGNLIREALKKIDQNKPVIVDGFPRTMDQIKAFEKALKEVNMEDNYLALDLKISEETALFRATHRLMCSRCGQILTQDDKMCSVCSSHELEQRKDDKPELVKNRLKFVSNELGTVKAYFADKNRLIEIDGERSVEEIFSDIESKLGLK